MLSMLTCGLVSKAHTRLQQLHDQGPARTCIESNKGEEEPGLVLKAHRRVYHSTLGSRVIKKKKNLDGVPGALDVFEGCRVQGSGCKVQGNRKRSVKAHRLG